MNTDKINSYFFAFIISIKYQFFNKAQLIGRVILYSIIVYLFYQIFESVNADYSKLLHVSFTQLINLSSVPVAFQIKQDLNNKQFEYFIIRKVNYTLFRFIEAIGMSFTNYIILLSCNIMLFFLLTKYHPDIISFCLGVICGFLSISLFIIITTVIGLLSYWVEDIKDIFYLNMTAGFCFGGLIVDLESYPQILKKICYFTPYPWLLSAPASIMNKNIDFTKSILFLTFWIIFFIFVIKILNKKMLDQYLERGQ